MIGVCYTNIAIRILRIGEQRSNCKIYNTGSILNSITPVLYQSIVTCMHEFNYAIVLRTIPCSRLGLWLGLRVKD